MATSRTSDPAMTPDFKIRARVSGVSAGTAWSAGSAYEASSGASGGSGAGTVSSTTGFPESLGSETPVAFDVAARQSDEGGGGVVVCLTKSQSSPTGLAGIPVDVFRVSRGEISSKSEPGTLYLPEMTMLQRIPEGTYILGHAVMVRGVQKDEGDQ